MKPRLLDLFCGAGGAAMGYSRAGFDVVGVDIAPQPRYPFEFVQADALEFMEFGADVGARWYGAGGQSFDAIHASPPCQRFSNLRHAAEQKGKDHPDLIVPTRELLEQTGLPWVIENVPGAPLNYSIQLCGSMFGLGSGDRQLRRHRLFETSFPILQPPCAHRGEAIGVYGGGPAVRANSRGRRGGYQGLVAEKREAMAIDWMNAFEINQAVPPLYTELIGHQLVQHLKVAA